MVLAVCRRDFGFSLELPSKAFFSSGHGGDGRHQCALGEGNSPTGRGSRCAGLGNEKGADESELYDAGGSVVDCYLQE